MPIDVTAARAATPGCQDLIHLNSAGAALPTHDVLTTQIDYLQLEARIGGYEAYTHEQARIEQIRPTIARLIGADPSGDEVALTVNNTAAFDLFLYSWAISPTHAPDPGDRILTTETEYGANFVAYLQLAGGSASRSRSFPPMTTEKSISTHLRPASDEPTSGPSR